MVEFIQDVGDGLVGQEDSHRRQHQVDEDEHHGEEVLHAGFTDGHRWTVPFEVIFCDRRRKGTKSQSQDIIQCGGMS